MSTPNNMEMRIKLNYVWYVMSAADATTLAGIMANAIVVEREYDSNNRTHIYKPVPEPHEVELCVLSINEQARLAMALASD